MKKITLLVLVSMFGFAVINCQEGGQESQEMMKKWQEFMTPGKYHQQLAFYEGDWTFAGKSWMSPQSPASPNTGTALGKMILGGRYLQIDYQGSSMGMPMEGINVTAFDNHLQVFHSIWIDNLGTGIFVSMGKPKDEKVREEVGELDDPMGSGKVKMRIVFTIISADSFKMEMYSQVPNMAEFKTMDVLFNRKK